MLKIYKMTAVEADRKLATIVTIANLEPIPKADNIEYASFKENSWNVVVKKNEFKVGDLAIYFSIDSILDPENEKTEFLEGKRLKTRRMLGVISQGLAAPLSWLADYDSDLTKYSVDDDVTQIMKVKKYVALDEQDLYKENSFPKHIVPKTDEERIQSYLKGLQKIVENNQRVVITKKFDGTSFTVLYVKSVAKEVFMACGRNQVVMTNEKLLMVDDSQPSTGKDEVSPANDHRTDKHYAEMVEKYDLEHKMKALGKNIAIQGEICGPKINGNRMKRTDKDFFVFNVWDIDNQYYLPLAEVQAITSTLGLKMVDLVHVGSIEDIPGLKINKPKGDSEYVKAVSKALLTFAGNQEYSKGVPAEGIVIKTDFGKEHERISFKVISNKYLIKHNE